MPEGEVAFLRETGGVGLVLGGGVPIDVPLAFAEDLGVEVLKILEVEDGGLPGGQFCAFDGVESKAEELPGTVFEQRVLGTAEFPAEDALAGTPHENVGRGGAGEYGVVFFADVAGGVKPRRGVGKRGFGTVGDLTEGFLGEHFDEDGVDGCGAFRLQPLDEGGQGQGVHAGVHEELVGIEQEVPMACAISPEEDFLPNNLVPREVLPGLEDVDAGIIADEVEGGVGGAVVQKDDARDAGVEVIFEHVGKAQGLVATDEEKPYFAWFTAGHGVGIQPMQAGGGQDATQATIDFDFQAFRKHGNRMPCPWRFGKSKLIWSKCI